MITSKYDYDTSVSIRALPNFTFYGCFIALVLSADTDNLARLHEAFPEATEEALARYSTPGGTLSIAEWQAAAGSAPGEQHQDILYGEFARAIEKAQKAIEEAKRYL